MKNRMPVIIALMGVALLSAVAPISAHHAMVAEFNLAPPITVRGTLREDGVGQPPRMDLREHDQP